MQRLLLATACLAFGPAAGWAQVITNCEWFGSPANIVEPWEANTRTYANGAIRIAALDTGGEPVCCSAHLLILSPSGDARFEPVFRQCHVFSAQEGSGFYGFDVSRTVSSYDAERGLLLSVPVYHWHEGIEYGRPPIEERVEIRINQLNGRVSWE